MESRTKKTIDATLLMAPGCSHCPLVLEALTRLIKAGKLGRLEIIDLTQYPAAGSDAGVRSVPWTRIGPFELDGVHSYAELDRWTEQAAAGTGFGSYYSHLLETRQLEKVIHLVREHPATLNDLVRLLATLETPMGVRIGVGAVLEELAESELLNSVVPELLALTRSPEPQIRADGCHYLSLSNSPDALAAVLPLLQDRDAEVRQIAEESLSILEAVNQTESDADGL
jgi:hypothetical protein